MSDAQDTRDDSAQESDCVVLVHGFGGKHAFMQPLAKRLQHAGYRVRCWNYRSYFDSVDRHGDRLASWLATELQSESRFHIVAHSMGCIVVRAALSRSIPANLGRIVLLAPPNHGSPAARIASRWLGDLIPPARELAAHPTSYVCQLPQTEGLEVGVLAARFDWLVPVRSTHLIGQRNHQVLPATHNSILLSRLAAQRIKSFLNTGEFETRVHSPRL